MTPLDWFTKQGPLQGMTGLWGGTQGALQQAGGGLPAISTFDELLSSKHANIEGAVTHNGYGFELYTGVKLGRSSNMTATLDTSNIDLIRFVLMGGGGSGSQLNILFGSASGGIEGTIDTSSMDSLVLQLGSGGAGFSGDGANAASDSSSQGGHSIIYLANGSTNIAEAEGGLVSGAGSGNEDGGYTDRPTTTFSNTYVSAISRADGGKGGAQNQSGREPAVTLNPTITGAYAHGACSGKHGVDLSGDAAMGYGGGGGGTYTTSNNYSEGGPLGYRGGMGTSDNGFLAEGPTVTTGNSYGLNSIGFSGYANPKGGGGGGAYGGAGGEVYDIGQGATGLVKMWWASNAGDASALATTGNLYT